VSRPNRASVTSTTDRLAVFIDQGWEFASSEQADGLPFARMQARYSHGST